MIKPYYQDDNCTIYNCDCKDILSQLPKVDLVLTDPPYGIKRDGNKNQIDRGFQTRKGYESKGWDKSPINFGLMWKLISLGKNAIVWGGNYYPMPPERGWIVWDKGQKSLTMGDGEIAWSNLKQPIRIFQLHRIHLWNEGTVHPTQKPIKLIKWCINQADGTDFERPKIHTILDPFMGSGTTLRASKDLNRKCIGIEIEEKYCEIAVQRLKQEVFKF